MSDEDIEPKIQTLDEVELERVEHTIEEPVEPEGDVEDDND